LSVAFNFFGSEKPDGQFLKNIMIGEEISAYSHGQETMQQSSLQKPPSLPDTKKNIPSMQQNQSDADYFFN
jgi:hypothetical protein